MTDKSYQPRQGFPPGSGPPARDECSRSPGIFSVSLWITYPNRLLGIIMLNIVLSTFS